MSGPRIGKWHEWPFEPMEILRVLKSQDVDFVVIGALAAILQGSPLPTYSLDIVVKQDAVNRSRLLGALGALNALTLTDVTDTNAALATEESISFHTQCGHIDVYRQAAGYKSYSELRRATVPVDLGPGLTVHALSLRGILASKLALGDTRQLPALEATLELSSSN